MTDLCNSKAIQDGRRKIVNGLLRFKGEAVRELIPVETTVIVSDKLVMEREREFRMV